MRYRVSRMEDLEKTRCPCGWTRRAFIDDESQIASLHIVEIEEDARTHYHQQMTEIYYVLEGSGHLELDEDQIPLTPGTAVMIKPGCRHRAVGRLKILNIPIPAFDPEDEFFDDEEPSSREGNEQR